MKSVLCFLNTTQTSGMVQTKEPLSLAVFILPTASNHLVITANELTHRLAHQQ